MGTNKSSLFNTTNTSRPHANAMRFRRYNPECAVASGLVVVGYWLLAPTDRRVSVALGLAIAGCSSGQARLLFSTYHRT